MAVREGLEALWDRDIVIEAVIERVEVSETDIVSVLESVGPMDTTVREGVGLVHGEAEESPVVGMGEPVNDLKGDCEERPEVGMGEPEMVTV